MAPPVQHMVVSNLAGQTAGGKTRTVKTALFFGVAFLLCLLLWLVSKANGFLIGAGISGVVLVIFAVLNRGDRQQGSRFICYTDPHQIVHLEYSNPQNDPFKQVIRIQFPVNALTGYTLHSFFGGEPAMMHLQARSAQGEYVLGPVPVEYLNAVQRQQLFSFLDALIVKTKRLRR